MKYKIQVDKSHYQFFEYVDQDRWLSYYHQLDCVMNISKMIKKSKLNILEIGVGNGLVANTLKHLGHKITTVDIDATLKPDIVATLPELVMKSGIKYDCVICCEVLEHLQYKDVLPSIKRLAKLSDFLVISVPHKSLHLSLVIRIPLFKPFKLLLIFPFFQMPHKFLGEHYWELGTKYASTKKFLNTIKKAKLTVVKEYQIKEHPWHHFFVLYNPGNVLV